MARLARSFTMGIFAGKDGHARDKPKHDADLIVGNAPFVRAYIAPIIAR